MVHTELEINCSAQVNLIIGANGSGKSSVVCAICLGLGGDTNDMQREKNISEFIRSGQEKSIIEITIQGERSFEYKIQRVLIREGNRSDWAINGEGCTMKVVHKLMERLHIQMDNPCQFLPQELVSGFTALNPVDLLKHVIQAVDPKLLDEHKRLVKDNTQRSENAEQLIQLKKQLSSLREKKGALAGDLAAFKEYELLKFKLEALDVQKLLCKAEEGREIAEKKRKEADFNRTSWKDRQAKLDELNEKKEKNEHLLAEREVSWSNAKNAKTKLMNESKQQCNNLKTIDEEINDLLFDISSMEGNTKEASEKLDKTKELIATLESDIKALPPLPSQADVETASLKHKAAIDLHNETNEKLQDVLDDLASTTEDMKLKEQRRDAMVKTNAARILEMEKDRYLQCNRSILTRKWVEENKQRFKNHVFGPLLIDIEVESGFAIQVEALLPNDIKYGFAVQSKEDSNVLKECPFYSDISITIVDADTVNSILSRPRLLSPETVDALTRSSELDLRWATDVIKADKVVKAAILSSTAAVFMVTEDTHLMEKVYDKKIVFPPNLNIASTKNIIRFFSSKYDNARSEQMSSVAPAKFLSIETSKDRVIHANQELTAALTRYKKLLEDKKALEIEQSKRGSEAQKALEMIRVLKERKNERQKKISRLNVHKASLTEQLDAMKGEENMHSQIAKKIVILREKQKLKSVLISRMEYTSTSLQSTASAALVQLLDFNMQKCVYQSSKDEHKEQFDRITKAGNDFNKVTKEVEKMEKDAKEKEKEYEKKKEELMEKDPAFEEIFTHLPTDLDAVNANVIETNAQLEGTQVDKNAKAAYDKVASEESDCERRISDLEKKLDERTQLLQNTILRLRGDILQRVGSLSTKFAKFMARIACKGNITFSGDEFDPKMWGIAVRVSFRGSNEPTQLSKTSHSGGECAVSTMLVLLAMQDVTSLPFRVVDEINQGMGVNFEKCVFVVLAELFEEQRAASAQAAAAAAARGGDGSSVRASIGKQLFIISPKLLPNLQHTLGMRTHVIFNGPDVKESTRIHRLFSSLCKLPTSLAQPAVVDEIGRTLKAIAEAEAKAKHEALFEARSSAPNKKAKKATRRKRKDDDDDDEEEDEEDDTQAPKKKRRVKKHDDNDDDDNEEEDDDDDDDE
jgi:structural maintenance of chromosomes protein 5